MTEGDMENAASSASAPGPVGPADAASAAGPADPTGPASAVGPADPTGPASAVGPADPTGLASAAGPADPTGPESATIFAFNSDFVSFLRRHSFFIVSALSFAILLSERVFVFLQHPLRAFPDQAAYLEMAELITRGKLPYVDFFEWNPPLIMYLNLIPVGISRLFHMPSILAFDFSVLGLGVISIFLSLWLAYKYLSEQDFACLLPMFLAFAYFNQNQITNMGEREHLFVLCYLPFFILRGIIWQGKSPSRIESVVCGVIAGVGMALKPQFVASAALVELCFWFQFRNLKTLFRPEIFSAALVFAAYLLLLLLLPAPVWQAYIHQVMPLYVEGLQYSSRALMVMVRGDSNFYTHFVHMIVVLPLAIVFSRLSPWIAPLGAFALSFFFHYVYGDQTWAYRFLPMTASLYMIDGLLLGLLLKSILSVLNLPRLTAIFCGLAMLGAASFIAYEDVFAEFEDHEIAKYFKMEEVGYRGDSPRLDLCPLFFAILSHTKPDDSIIFMGTGIDPGFPAILQSGRAVGTRYLFCTLALIEHCLSQTEDAKWKNMAELVISNYGEDIVKNKPAAIIIQDPPLIAILKQHQFFARFMSNYEEVGVSELNHIWLRTGEATGAKPAKDPQQIIIDILANRESIQEAAQESGLEQAKIERWVYLSRQALSRALSKHTSDQQADMEAEIIKLNDHIRGLLTENESLKLRLERLEKTGQPPGKP